MSTAVEAKTLPVVEVFGPVVQLWRAAHRAMLLLVTEKPGIYSICHRATGRVYVGSATNISKRWSRHRKDLRAGEHRNAHLQAAWSKYGEDAFEWAVLEFTTDLDVREQFWMDELRAYDDGFNLCPTARSSRGRTWSAEERAARAARVHLRRPRRDREALAARAREMARSLRKLTDHQVAEIRARYGCETMQALADEYNVSITTVHDVVHRKVYA